LYKIIEKQALGEIIKLMVIQAPHIAKKAKAGQFVILRINEFGERIPLTIADFDPQAGTITVIFQEVGKSTRHLWSLNPGDSLETFAGPLGNPSEIKQYGNVVCIAGGVGVAPMYSIAKALKNAGNKVISIIGARNKGLLFWEERMRSVSDELIVCTDDGTYGRKAVVTAPLKEILTLNNIARVWAIGPAIMMKFVSMVTMVFNIPTVVSLNTVMIDGTGMCGGCRVLHKEGAKFVCVDGPEFDGHKIAWDNLLLRQGAYRNEEAIALKHWEHTCHLEKSIEKDGH
jgi:ferredoxin--NADP+ reductase